MGSLTNEIQSVKSFLIPSLLSRSFNPIKLSEMGGALRGRQFPDTGIGSMTAKQFRELLMSQLTAEENISDEKKYPPKPKDHVSDEGLD